VTAPTLLIVGGRDEVVLDHNRFATSTGTSPDGDLQTRSRRADWTVGTGLR